MTNQMLTHKQRAAGGDAPADARMGPCLLAGDGDGEGVGEDELPGDGGRGTHGHIVQGSREPILGREEGPSLVGQQRAQLVPLQT